MRSAKIMTVCFVAVLGVLALCGPAWAVEGMISYWKFDEGSGVTAGDSVGANDGTLINGPVWTTGQVNTALSFDGVNDYVSIPDSGSLDITESITVEAWIKLDDNNKEFSIIEKGGAWNTTKDLSWLFDMNIPWPSSTSPGKLRVVISKAGDSADLIIRSNSIITTGAWHHVAWTYDGSTVNIYTDGLLVVLSNFIFVL